LTLSVPDSHIVTQSHSLKLQKKNVNRYSAQILLASG